MGYYGSQWDLIKKIWSKLIFKIILIRWKCQMICKPGSVL